MPYFNIYELIANLLFTVFIYMSIPVIYMFIQKKVRSEKKLRVLAVLNSIIIYLLIMIVRILMETYVVPKVGPAFFYGFINLWLMRKRNSKFKPVNQPEEQQRLNITDDYSSNYYNDAFTYRNTEVIERKKISPWIISTAILSIACASIIFIFFSTMTVMKNEYNALAISRQEYKDALTEANSEIIEKNKEIGGYMISTDDLKNEIDDLERELHFYDRAIVFVADDGTNRYHNLNCKYLDLSYGYWAFNVEYAKGREYLPCKHCQ